jgi:hypothetical protein
VTDIVLPYMGPNYDWHKVPIDPSFFNNTAFLTFEMADGTEQTVFSNITKQPPVTPPSRPSSAVDDDIDQNYIHATKND